MFLAQVSKRVALFVLLPGRNQSWLSHGQLTTATISEVSSYKYQILTSVTEYDWFSKPTETLSMQCYN